MMGIKDRMYQNDAGIYGNQIPAETEEVETNLYDEEAIWGIAFLNYNE